MFDSIKKFLGRLDRKKSALALRHVRKEETVNTEASKAIIDLGKSGKSFHGLQLPTIPQLKPLSSRNLFGEVDDKSWVEKGSINDGVKSIKRKLMSGDTWTSDNLYNGPFKFDPYAPLTNKSINACARKILKKKYQSKFTIDFTPPQGLTVRSYDFLWVDEEELDRKVLDDIVWVRQRYAQARKTEPSDQDIIWWYNANNYENEM